MSPTEGLGTGGASSYRAVINWDIEGSGGGDMSQPRQKFYAALRQLGWEKTKTTAMVIETPDINAVLRGIVCFVKMQADMGTALSSVTFNVQRHGDAGGSVPEPSSEKLREIEQKSFPW